MPGGNEAGGGKALGTLTTEGVLCNVVECCTFSATLKATLKVMQ